MLRTPVYELDRNMGFEEYQKWFLYFQQRPVGWREDDRAFKIMQSSGNIKGGPDRFFTSLAVMLRNQNEERRAIVPRSGSYLHQAMLQAKGGDKLEILKEL